MKSSQLERQASRLANHAGQSFLKVTSVSAQIAAIALLLAGLYGMKIGLAFPQSWLVTAVAERLNFRGLYETSALSTVLSSSLLFGVAISAAYSACVLHYLAVENEAAMTRPEFQCLGEALWTIVFKPAGNFVAFLGCNAACLGTRGDSSPNGPFNLRVLASFPAALKAGKTESFLLFICLVLSTGMLKIGATKLLLVSSAFVFVVVHNIAVRVLLARIRGKS